MPGTLLTRPTARQDARVWPDVSSNGALPKSVGSRCGVNAQNGGIVGTVTGETLLQDHKILANCDGIRLAYSNSYGGGRTLASNPIYVRASIKDAAGFWHQASWNNATEVLLLPGLPTGIADSIGIGFSNADRAQTRTFVRVANVGELVPNGATTRNSPYVDGVASGDQTTASAPTFTVDGNYHFGPSAILADFTDASCIVGIYGDSIAAGQNDNNSNMDQLGWVLRALNDQWPYLQLSIAGDSATGFKAPVSGGGATTRKPRMPLAVGITHAVIPLGTNDVGSTTAAQIKDSLIRCWTAAYMRGQKAIACTIPPSGVTSTDGYTTLGNQTVYVNDSRRTDTNDWMRAGAPLDPATKSAVAIGTANALTFGHPKHPAIGLWRVAEAVESSLNSGKWRVDLGPLTDGTHPNAAGSALMAAAADLSLLGPTAPGAAAPAPVVDPSTIFGAGLYARYVSTAITGKNDGDAMSQWNDSSGNGRHLVQATGTKQPLYKTNVNYSKPAVRFDGTDDFMNKTGLSLTHPFEIWIIGAMRTASTGANRYMVAGQGGSFNDAGKFGIGNPPLIEMYAGTSLNVSAGAAGVHLAFHAWAFRFNTTTSAILRDGTQIKSGNAGSATWTGLTVGADGNGDNPGDLDVQEIIVISRASTTQERADLAAYFVSTYATP